MATHQIRLLVNSSSFSLTIDDPDPKAVFFLGKGKIPSFKVQVSPKGTLKNLTLDDKRLYLDKPDEEPVDVWVTFETPRKSVRVVAEHPAGHKEDTIGNITLSKSKASDVLTLQF